MATDFKHQSIEIRLADDATLDDMYLVSSNSSGGVKLDISWAQDISEKDSDKRYLIKTEIALTLAQATELYNVLGVALSGAIPSHGGIISVLSSGKLRPEYRSAEVVA